MKAGKAYATVSEDMDSLTFGSSILIRGMSTSKNTKGPELVEIELPKVLSALNLTHEKFVDLCILCGCDYTNTIGGIGPVKAFKFIQDYDNIENVLKHVEKEIAHQNSGKKTRYIIPDEFTFEDARHIFLNNEYPELLSEVSDSLKWTKPDEIELKDFLVNKKGFNPEKMDNGMKKLAKSIPLLGKTQVRLDNFFKSSGAPSPLKPNLSKQQPTAKKPAIGSGFKSKKK